MTYRLISAKGCRTVTGTITDAVAAAVEMDEQLQPAFGVSVENESGETVADIRGGIDIHDGETV